MVMFRYFVIIDDFFQEDGWGLGDFQIGFIVWNYGDVGGWFGNCLFCLGLIYIIEVFLQFGFGFGLNLLIKLILLDIFKKEGDRNVFKICIILNLILQER